ncbi:MAG: hypothetical protein ABSD03_04680 [Vulcanimicrobiaceae bacterium]
MRVTLAGAVLAALVIVMPLAPVRADPFEASLTLSINLLEGQHNIGDGEADAILFAPLPLAELDLREGRESIHLEGLPSVTFSYASNPDGAQATRLSLINATFRHALGHGWFLGFGQTVYNQSTYYGEEYGERFYAYSIASVFADGAETQYSRVTGPRLEVGRSFVRGRNRVEAVVGVNSSMHGVQYTQVATGEFTCSVGRGCVQYVPTYANPEGAAQVDLSLRVARRLSRRGELLYGLRYLNYSAHYVAPLSPLSDRNVGFAPVIAYRLRL